MELHSGTFRITYVIGGRKDGCEGNGRVVKERAFKVGLACVEKEREDTKVDRVLTMQVARM